MTRYDYLEMVENVKKYNPPRQEDVDALGAWFEHHGAMYWNGEYYDTDEFRLYPVYAEDGCGDFEIIGYKVN